MAAMRAERWASLLADKGIHGKATVIASHIKGALVEAMQLRADLQARARGGDVDAAAAVRELDEVCEHLEQHLAVAMNRLPQSRRRELAGEVEGAAATATLKRGMVGL